MYHMIDSTTISLRSLYVFKVHNVQFALKHLHIIISQLQTNSHCICCSEKSCIQKWVGYLYKCCFITMNWPNFFVGLEFHLPSTSLCLSRFRSINNPELEYQKGATYKSPWYWCRSTKLRKSCQTMFSESCHINSFRSGKLILIPWIHIALQPWEVSEANTGVFIIESCCLSFHISRSVQCHLWYALCPGEKRQKLQSGS